MERKWWLVITGCVTHAVNTGFSYFGMSAFFPSFEREFGWSRTAISGAFSLARVESGILGPIEGYLTDRVGAQRMLFIGLILCTLGFLSLSFVHSLPMLYVVDRGWSTEAASGLLGLSALIGAPARIGMGWLGDMVDKRRLVMGLLLALSLSVLFMGYTAVAIIFTPCMIIYSLAYGGLASLQEPIRADYFGTKAFATIQGMSRSVTTAGTFLGPIIAGFCYDLTKSYTIAFSFFALVSLLAAALMFLARPPQVPAQ